MWQNFPLFPDQASTIAPKVDAIFFFGLGVAAFFSLLIAVLVIALAVRYRRRRPDQIGEDEAPHDALEIVWSVIPLLILLVMFGWGARVYFQATRPPANAVEYYGIGKQWMWKFQHPSGVREINELHVPLGKPIKVKLTSEDVIHDFFVPAFRVKYDVIPGRYTTVWFQATKVGTYHLFCDEYCGAEHSRMVGSIVVMDPKDYEQWLTRGGGAAAPAASGEELFSSLACSTCHRTDSTVRAPLLVGLYGSQVQLADGSTVKADDDYVRESILNPQAKVVNGFQPIMPSYKGQVSEEQILQLINYIKSLAAPAGGATPTPAPGKKG